MEDEVSRRNEFKKLKVWLRKRNHCDITGKSQWAPQSGAEEPMSQS